MSPSTLAGAPFAALRIATYNVHGCVGVDGCRDVARIGGVLRELEADVIALQEVATPEDTRDTLDELAQLTGLRALWTPVHRRDGVHYGNALLTKLPVHEERTIELTYLWHEPRSALDVELDANGLRLRVIATHLGLRPAERRFQVREILKVAAREAGDLTVLLGDINEWWIRGRPLRWLHAHFGRMPSLRTFPSRWPIFALDRVWVEPPSALQTMQVWVDGEARRASDHLPVVATITRGARADR